MAIDFTEKLGPLPVWGWGVIGGGIVIVGAYVLNRGKGRDSGEPSVQSAVIDASGYQTAGITGGSASIPSTENFDNNVLWLTRASTQTAARLTKSPTVVIAALQKWLYGQTLSDAEKQIVDTAVGIVGFPPEGTQGISPVQAPDVYPPAGQSIIGTTASGARYLFSNSSGKILKWISYPEWVALTQKYGKLKTTIISTSQMKPLVDAAKKAKVI